MREIIKWAILAATFVLCSATAQSRILEPGTKTTAEVAGRTVSCPISRYKGELATVSIQRNDPNEGEAASGDTSIFLYQPMFGRAKPTAQLFIYYHECGHLQIEGGGSELRADKFAIETGIEQGWLVTDEDYEQVCDSWEGAPAVGEHPSAKRRCAQVREYMDKAAEARTAQLEAVAKHNREEAARVEAAKPWWKKFWR